MNPCAADWSEAELLQLYDLENYLFTTVRDRFAEEGEIGAFDFFCIVIWKANRAKSKVAKRLLSRSGTDLEGAVRRLTRETSSQASDQSRLGVLLEAWGFRLPMATSILSVLYPDRFTVYDVRVCEVLGRFSNLDGVSPSRVWEGYDAYREAVRDSVDGQLSLRDKDRVLWACSFARELRTDVTRGFEREVGFHHEGRADTGRMNVA